MRKLAVIGANEFQAPLIQKAKEMGFETHVFAWAADDVGEKLADRFHPISITEKEAIWQVCKAEGVEGCCSIGSDLAVHTVNYVQRRLGIPCNPEITDTIATDKYEMRRALTAAGVACPRFLKVAAPPAEETLSGMAWPLIVKPTDRSGSRGIFQVSDYSSLCAAIPQAAAQSFHHEAIIEEVLTGPEYSCESLSFAGEHHILALTKKYTTGAPHFIETGHDEPADIPADLIPAIHTEIKTALDALSIRYGASHGEFRLGPDGRAHIIEIGARMGGDCIGSDLVYLSTGVDYMAAVIDVALGHAPDLAPKREPHAAAVRFIFTRDDAEKLERIKRDAPESLWRWSHDGHPDGGVTDSASRHGWWITLGECL